eukprot:3420505-Heterocapsa_arctica.AAC.1
MTAGGSGESSSMATSSYVAAISDGRWDFSIRKRRREAQRASSVKLPEMIRATSLPELGRVIGHMCAHGAWQ